MKALAKVLTRGALVQLAGERYFERGDQKNKVAYREARDLILKVRDLMRRAGREPEFAAYLDPVRAAHRRKRNLMALLEGIE